MTKFDKAKLRISSFFKQFSNAFPALKIDDRLFTALILALIAGPLAYGGGLVRFDNLYFDLGHYLSSKPAPKDVIIVAVDEISLAHIGRWPWSRNIHADLVNVLSEQKAKVIGLDIIFSDPDILNPESDLALQTAITKAGNVVLPVLFEVSFAGAPVKETTPLPLFAENAAALGRVHVPLDADGFARSIYLDEGLASSSYQDKKLNGFLWAHFAEAVLQVANELPRGYQHLSTTKYSPQLTFSDDYNQIVRERLRKVNFIGPPNHFQRISYTKVLTDDYPKDFFKDKIVLIGATAAGMGDVLPTAVSALAAPMSGIEFQANVIEAMRNNQLIIEAPLWLTVVVCIGLAIFPLLWLPKLSPLQSLLLITGYYFVVILLVLVLPQYFNLWVAPAGALVAILLAYPIWSWRKLESAQAYLDIELQNLRDDLASIGVDQTYLDSSTYEDPLQARINKVKRTAELLRDLHRDRSNALAFISHDIRAPLGSAMMLLNEVEKTKYSDRVMKMLARAHGMAESFLQVSRAEIANAKQFQEIDFVSLVQQVLDDAYAAAKQKNVKFSTKYSPENIWIKADFGLLERAVANVVLNAVKYSPENAMITVDLSEVNLKEHKQAVLKVTDYGPGIPADKMPKLFKRFSRAEGDHQATDGTGLGLFFVELSVKKHQGSVAVESVVGEYTTFIIQLPCISE